MMLHHLTDKDREVMRLIYRDYHIRHKKCSACKWADRDNFPECRIKGKRVDAFQRIRANFCQHYELYDPE